MRKSIIAVVVLIVALLLSLPYIMGVVAKNKLDAIVTYLQKSKQIKVEALNYQQGWFNSTANFSIRITNPNLLQFYEDYLRKNIIDADTPLTFNLRARIQHGPFLYYLSRDSRLKFDFGRALIKSRLTLKQHKLSHRAKMLTTEPVLHAVTSIAIDGNMQTNAYGLSFAYINKPKQRLFYAHGFKAQVWTDANLSKIRTLATVYPIEFVSRESALELGTTHLNSDNALGVHNLWFGKSAAETVGLKWSFGPKGHQHKIAVQKIKFSNELRDTQNFAHAMNSLSFAKLEFNQVKLGPFKYQGEFHQLDVPSLAQLQSLIKISNQLMAKEQRINQAITHGQHQAVKSQLQATDAQINHIQQKIFAVLPQLLGHGAEFDLNELTLTTQDGVIQANGKAKFAQQRKYPNLMTLLVASEANVSINAPIPLIKRLLVKAIGFKQARDRQYAKTQSQMSPSSKQKTSSTAVAQVVSEDSQVLADQQLDKLVADKFLIVSGNNYILNLAYVKGQFTLNSKILKDMPLQDKQVKPFTAPAALGKAGK